MYLLWPGLGYKELIRLYSFKPQAEAWAHGPRLENTKAQAVGRLLSFSHDFAKQEKTT